MIGSLRGTVLMIESTEALIEVAGIGYRVSATGRTLAALGSPGNDAFLYVHDHRREDAQTLFAFASLEERQVFEALIRAHGVGPTLALAILSVHTPNALRVALATDDLAALCLVPGVGRKTATRLLVELKSSLADAGLPDPGRLGTDAGNLPVDRGLAEVREALSGLGYSGEEVGWATASLDGDDASALLKAALRRLAEGA